MCKYLGIINLQGLLHIFGEENSWVDFCYPSFPNSFQGFWPKEKLEGMEVVSGLHVRVCNFGL